MLHEYDADRAMGSLPQVECRATHQGQDSSRKAVPKLPALIHSLAGMTFGKSCEMGAKKRQAYTDAHYIWGLFERVTHHGYRPHLQIAESILLNICGILVEQSRQPPRQLSLRSCRCLVSFSFWPLAQCEFIGMHAQQPTQSSCSIDRLDQT